MAEILPLNEETMDIEIELCLRLHPSGFVHDEEYFRRGREMKRNFLKRVLRRVNPAGFVAVRGSKPAGLLELMPREYARLNGYITGTKGDDGLTLTIACLEVAVGEDRSSVMEELVSHLTLNLRLFQPYRRIEVGAFPGDVAFHPAWVYEKNGFEAVEDRERAIILTIQIPG